MGKHGVCPSLPLPPWNPPLTNIIFFLSQRHIEFHTGVRPFHCSTCGKSYRQAKTLKTHIRLHSEKPYRCPLCNKVFLHYSTLIQHEFCNTCEEKPFECDICKATFAFEIYLDYHMCKHLGTKAVTCPKCEKQCYDSSSLRQHLATHSGKCTVHFWHF